MSNAAPKIPPDPTPKLVAEQSDYSEIILLNTLTNVSFRDRKGQQVSTLRSNEGAVFKEKPYGVEVTGNSAWKGTISWANIKMAKR